MPMPDLVYRPPAPEETDAVLAFLSRGIAGAGNAKKAAVGEGVGCLKVYRKALNVTECLLAQR